MRAISLGLALTAIGLGCGSAGTTSDSGSGGASPGTDAGSGIGSGAAPGDGGGTGSGGNIHDGGTVVPVKHALNIHVTGNGGVQGGANDCRTSCQQQFDDGHTVHLVAVPDAKFHFDGWQGDCSGTGTCDLSMSADRSVVATFSLAATITVAPNGTGSGRVTSSPVGIDCPHHCTMSVGIGTPVTLMANPDAGTTFRGWGAACSGGSVCKFAAYSDQTVWANFEVRAQSTVSPCAAMAPAAAPPSTQYVQSPWYDLGFACGAGAADASGTLALVLNGAHGDAIDFVSPSGTFLGYGSTSLGGFLLDQPMGFLEVSGPPYLGPDWALRYGQLISDFDSTGNGTGTNYLANHSGQQNLPAAADPNGGVLFAGDFAMRLSDPTLHAAVMYNGGGTSAGVRWGPKPLASVGAVFGVGVDVLGRSLVITDGAGLSGGTVSAQWFDTDGSALTGEFGLLTGFSAGSSTWFATTALIGGGVLVRRMDGPSHARALVLLESGSSTVKPAPDWMVLRRDVKLQITRGGQAYAALPLGAKGVPCTQRVEVLAPDGISCGAMDYPIAGGGCDTVEMKLGADGTIIQQLPAALEQSNDIVGGHTCTWRCWAAALR